MAATITDIGNANGWIEDPSLTRTTGATITGTLANKDWFVVAVSEWSWGSGTLDISSVTDSAGNTYTRRVVADYTPNDSARVSLWTAPVTTDITNGTITVTWSSGALTPTGIQVYRVRPESGKQIQYVASGSGTGAAATGHTVGPSSITSSDIIFAASAKTTNDTVTGDSDTTNGSWSTAITRSYNSGIDATSSSCTSQYKQVSATGNQTWTSTTAASRSGIAAYIELSEPTAAQTIEALVGSYTVTGTAASPEHGWKTTAAGGSYAVTGTDAEFDFGVRLNVDAGSYAVTGTAASLEHGYKPTAGAGPYTVTGTDATLSISSDKSIVAAAGSYLVTGFSANAQLFTEAEVASGSMPLKYYAPRVHCYVEVTPVIQAAAYSANDIVFVATEVENATWRSTPGGEEMFVESIGILDEANNTAANWTFYFARSTFTLGSINGAVSVSDADARVITSVYTMASTKFFDLANSKFGYEGGLKLSVIPTTGSPQSKSVWVAATTAGTPTYGTTSDIKLKLHFVS